MKILWSKFCEWVFLGFPKWKLFLEDKLLKRKISVKILQVLLLTSLKFIQFWIRTKVKSHHGLKTFIT